jgi:hypothetical protein
MPKAKYSRYLLRVWKHALNQRKRKDFIENPNQEQANRKESHINQAMINIQGDIKHLADLLTFINEHQTH